MTGFLLNDTRIFSRKGIFLEHHFNNFMVREDRQYVKAYEVGFKNRSGNLKKVFGEFFEREVLINNNDSQEFFVNTNSLIYNIQKKMPKGLFILKDRFVDSNGMASHTFSEKAIQTAFFEFFERQSFITNYLSRTTASEIILGDNKDLIKSEKYLQNYVDTVKYFNISLSEKIFVILCIGYGCNKCVGLGTSSVLEEAISKSQIEALQYFATEYSKYNTSKEIIDRSEDKDIYHSKFDELTIDKFIDSYSYLIKNNTDFANICTNLRKMNFSFPVLLDECRTKLKMNPVISTFYSNQKISHLKIVKIVDENWFPHMNPNFFEEKSYTFVESIVNKKLDDSIKYIPFP